MAAGSSARTVGSSSLVKLVRVGVRGAMGGDEVGNQEYGDGKNGGCMHVGYLIAVMT